MDSMAPDVRAALMSRIRGKDTLPELMLRREVWSLGLRYRLYRQIGKTKPDMVFLGTKVAVFVDGCFWHRCPLHFVMPKNNREFWKKKIERNVQRDAEVSQWLTEAGWVVLRFWEHEVEKSAKACARKIARHVGRARKTRGAAR